MKQLPALLLLLTAALPIGAKWKVKEKRFDPIAVTNVQQIAGRYVGWRQRRKRQRLAVLPMAFAPSQ